MTDLDEKKKLRYEKMKATRLANNPDAYKQMGSLGGKKTSSRPFRTNRSLASKAGLISGEKRRAKLQQQ